MNSTHSGRKECNSSSLRSQVCRVTAPRASGDRRTGDESDCRVSRTMPGTLVSGAVFLNRKIERLRQLRGCGICQPNLSAFNQSDGRRTYACKQAKGRLQKASEDAQISWVSLGIRHNHDVSDCAAQDLHGSCQQIDLRGHGTLFPLTQGGFPDFGESRKFGDRQARRLASLSQEIRPETAEHTTAHNMSLSVMSGHHAATPLTSTQDVQIERAQLTTRPVLRPAT